MPYAYGRLLSVAPPPCFIEVKSLGPVALRPAVSSGLPFLRDASRSTGTQSTADVIFHNRQEVLMACKKADSNLNYHVFNNEKHYIITDVY